MPLDLHVLGLPLAFILSQDQTLHCKKLLCFIRVLTTYIILCRNWINFNYIFSVSLSIPVNQRTVSNFRPQKFRRKRIAKLRTKFWISKYFSARTSHAIPDFFSPPSRMPLRRPRMVRLFGLAGANVATFFLYANRDGIFFGKNLSNKFLPIYIYQGR